MEDEGLSDMVRDDVGVGVGVEREVNHRTVHIVQASAHRTSR